MCKSSEKWNRESGIVIVRMKRNKGQTANIEVGQSFVPVGALTPLTGCVQERGRNRMVLRSVLQKRKQHQEILYKHFFPNSEAV